MDDVLGGGDRVGELDEVRLTVLETPERAPVLELVAERDHVDGRPPLVELEHGLEDVPVGR